MRGLLLDTHVWFWFLSGSNRLPSRLRHRISREVDTCWLSPISVWELGLLVARGRIRLDREYRRWLAAASNLLPLRDAPLTRAVALSSNELELPHRDPADRFLVATAQVYDLALATVDSRIIESRIVDVFSS